MQQDPTDEPVDDDPEVLRLLLEIFSGAHSYQHNDAEADLHYEEDEHIGTVGCLSVVPALLHFGHGLFAEAQCFTLTGQLVDWFDQRSEVDRVDIFS